jgi:hypothetical protein
LTLPPVLLAALGSPASEQQIQQKTLIFSPAAHSLVELFSGFF